MTETTKHKGAKKIGYKAYSFGDYEIYFIDGIDYTSHEDYQMWTIWEKGTRYECGGGPKASATTLRMAKAIITKWN